MAACRTAVWMLVPLVLAVGCVPGATTRQLPPWPTLDTGLTPDVDVNAPAWYQAPEQHAPWPLGQEPEHGTEAWRQWCALRYESRDIVRWAEVPPEVDGRLTDAVWRNSAFAGAFANPEMRRASPSTTVFLAYDKEMLYVAARAIEPNSEDIRATPSERDALPRSDDLFEINFAPRWKDKMFRVCWFIVNPAGSISDGVDAEGAWNPNVKVAAAVSEGVWTLELAVPLRELGVSVDDLWGEVWACRFVRHRRAGGVREVSSWTRILNADTGTSNWGHVIFRGPKPQEPRSGDNPDAETEKKAEEEHGR